MSCHSQVSITAEKGSVDPNYDRQTVFFLEERLIVMKLKMK